MVLFSFQNTYFVLSRSELMSLDILLKEFTFIVLQDFSYAHVCGHQAFLNEKPIKH